MSTFLTIILALAALAVAAVLVTGIVSFMRGGEADRRQSLKLMNLRVAVQALALVLLVIAIVLGRG